MLNISATPSSGDIEIDLLTIVINAIILDSLDSENDYDSGS